MVKVKAPRQAFQRLGVVAAMVGLAACSAPQTPSSADSPTALPAYLPSWEVYEVMEDATFDLPEGDLTPFGLAQSLLAEPESLECFRVAQVRVETLENGNMAVLSTLVGLCDDSVAALEQRIDLAPTPTGWMLDKVGQRFGCARPAFAWAEPGALCP
jgi:hypothetical protein